ncbi:uncharacterized protein LOC142332968 [Lycorma delicatula]|uniref:uncharacterized protein LOC142332968 n=1 Tax=Lycorma delicatula TaxID=130591 RepID=UPI003F518BBF
MEYTTSLKTRVSVLGRGKPNLQSLMKPLINISLAIRIVIMFLVFLPAMEDTTSVKTRVSVLGRGKPNLQSLMKPLINISLAIRIVIMFLEEEKPLPAAAREL